MALQEDDSNEDQYHPSSTTLEAQENDDERSPFPVRLHMVLTESVDGSSPELEDVVCFQPHGRAFKILDPDSFCVQVLPRLFPTTTQVSWVGFLGKLTRYGFRRLTNAGPDQGAYYHPLFLLGEPQLARRITIRRSMSVPRQADEPNFSQFPVCVARPHRTAPSSPAARGIMSLRDQHVLMFEPTVGASTLPPAQFMDGGSSVLMSLLVPGMSHRRLVTADDVAQEVEVEPTLLIDDQGRNNGTGGIDLQAILDMPDGIGDEY